MSEPIGTFLMPLYAILSWYGLYTQGNTGSYVLPVSLIGWFWALINILRTNRLDLGIVTFFFVIVAAFFERQYGLTGGVKLALCISAIMVAANYSLVIAFWGDIQKDLARSKSPLWLKIFWGYCASMMSFWVCVCAKNYMRDGRGFSAVR